MKRPAVRCINIDWLEMYVYEPAEPRDIEYFESRGFMVRDRGYGTKHWSQVFVILDQDGDDFIEVRRAPRAGSQGHHTIYPDNAANLRLVNRYCYHNTAMWLMANFMEKHDYEFRRIFRLDLALDFTEFDSGDKPRDVMRRIAKHVYAKVYQAKRSIHGDDRWNDCQDNSVSWGKKGSMVVTRFYNKSLELAEVKDKPWIRQAWYEAGLIADPLQKVLLNNNGEVIGPEVWRLEFQINSSARGWFVIDGEHADEYVEHGIETYWNRPLLEIAFANLVDHYFQFRIFKQGVSKYECKPKKLFDLKHDDCHYRLRNSLVKRIYEDKADSELRWLQRFRMTLSDPDMMTLTDQLIARLAHRTAIRQGYDRNEDWVRKLRDAFDAKHRRGSASVSVDTERDLELFDTINPPKPL